MYRSSSVRCRNLTFALAFALFGVVLSLGLAPEAGAQQQEDIDETPGGIPYVAGELLISYADDASNEEKNEALDETNAQTEETLPELDSRLVEFPEIQDEPSQESREQALERKREALEEKPEVESADYNYVVKGDFVPRDPLRDKQYALGKVRAFEGWEYSRGRGTDIAVLDTGIDQNHPDLGKVARQRDFVNNDSTANDDNGHGSHVAGTAAALTDNRRGVAGACPSCRLLVGKVLNENNVGTVGDLIDGIIWATNNGAEVINLSLGHRGEVGAEEDAVDYARNNGAVVVGAAGNGGRNVAIYPGAYRKAISVAATTRDDRRANFSNYGEWVDLAAPGVRILSTVRNGYGYKSGTSISTPHVSALAGLISAQGYSAGQVRNRMQTTAADLGPRGKDVGFGHGRVDFYRAAYRGYQQVVDNSSDRFSASDDWDRSRWNNQKAGPNYRVTKPATRSGTAKFRVNVPSTTEYDVYAWWPDHPRFNSRTRYYIRTVGGWKVKVVDQRKNGGKFNYLGTYRMPYGDKNYIRVAGRSGKPGYIIADAVLIRRR